MEKCRKYKLPSALRNGAVQLVTIGFLAMQSFAQEKTNDWEAGIAARDGSLMTEWVTVEGPASAIHFSPGPVQGSEGVSSTESVTLNGLLARPLSSVGSLSFWMKLPRSLHTGTGVKAQEWQSLEIKGLMSVTLRERSDHVQLIFSRPGEGKGEFAKRYNNIHVQLPMLPGGEWIHVAVQWDAGKGVWNAYLDGTPFYFEGSTIPSWQSQTSREVIIRLGGSAIAGELADIRIANQLMGSEDWKPLHVAGRFGALDGLLGSGSLGKLGEGSQKGKILYEAALTQSPPKPWIMEGPGEVTFSRDGMMVQSTQPESTEGHLVYWCPEDFPDSFIAEWDFQLLSKDGLCIVFFAANGNNGQDLFSPDLEKRTGIYDQYIKGDIHAYHISYYACMPFVPRRVSNLRKSPGFFLMANGPSLVGDDSAFHHAVLVKDGGYLRMAIDGDLCIDYTDEGKVHGAAFDGGKIGFRQMSWTKAIYRNFRVYGYRPVK